MMNELGGGTLAVEWRHCPVNPVLESDHVMSEDYRISTTLQDGIDVYSGLLPRRWAF